LVALRERGVDDAAADQEDALAEGEADAEADVIGASEDATASLEPRTLRASWLVGERMTAGTTTATIATSAATRQIAPPMAA